MGVLFKLLLVILNLICIGIDIAIFFLLCRFVLMWRTRGWLERLNDVGKSLVDAVTGHVGQLWHRKTQKLLSDKGELAVSIVALSLVRLVISEVERLF